MTAPWDTTCSACGGPTSAKGPLCARCTGDRPSDTAPIAELIAWFGDSAERERALVRRRWARVYLALECLTSEEREHVDEDLARWLPGVAVYPAHGALGLPPRFSAALAVIEATLRRIGVMRDRRWTDAAAAAVPACAGGE